MTHQHQLGTSTVAQHRPLTLFTPQLHFIRSTASSLMITTYGMKMMKPGDIYLNYTELHASETQDLLHLQQRQSPHQYLHPYTSLYSQSSPQWSTPGSSPTFVYKSTNLL